jgi:hypothetical protein
MRAWVYFLNLLGLLGYIATATLYPAGDSFTFGYVMAALLCLFFLGIDDWPVNLPGLIGSWIVTGLIYAYFPGDTLASFGVSAGFTLCFIGSCLFARSHSANTPKPPNSP